MTTKKMAILTDTTKCIGCEECVVACQRENKLPRERPWRWLQHIHDLSSARWTTLKKVRDSRGTHFVRKHCRHCLKPACVEACIVGALQKTPAGPVTYSRDICIGCRYCMIVCPWDIPRYSWEDAVPFIQKCDFCAERLQQGKKPACVEACPTGATIFGEREALLAEARRRIKREPQKYKHHIWGETEVGGTSVLYLSDVELHLTDLASSIRDKTPVSTRTFEVLRHMPKVFLGMAAAMGGVHWIISRRQKLRGQASPLSPEEEAKTSQEEDPSSPQEER
jgi:formate dehydrogenase iron-sulfur subunit